MLFAILTTGKTPVFFPTSHVLFRRHGFSSLAKWIHPKDGMDSPEIKLSAWS